MKSIEEEATFLEMVDRVPVDVSLRIIARQLDKLKEKPVVLKYKKLDDSVIDPYKANDSDMCFDIYANSEGKFYNKEGVTFVEYSTGLFFEIPTGYAIRLVPRSSISNYSLLLANSPGTVDELYRKEVFVRFRITTEVPFLNNSSNLKIYNKGERICQMNLEKVVPTTLLLVDEIQETHRGGFGSTGK